MHHLSCDVFFLPEWHTHCQTTAVEIWHVPSKPLSIVWGGGSKWKIIMWHYKETNTSSLWRRKSGSPLYVITDISAPFGGAENCFHNECGSQGNEWDIWMGEHAEGSPKCTEVTEQPPLGHAVFVVCLLRLHFDQTEKASQDLCRLGH